MIDLRNHPCFNPEACKSHGRVHLPVAPRCNVQCRFCNRRFDCVNETRPGVTSAVLSPVQAMGYLETVFRRRSDIAVVGIAGPGDPFANVDETLETLGRVRAAYPDVILCVATNGLNLAPHLDALKERGVSHVTVTVNAVDPAVGARIYAWMRVGKRVVRAGEGAAVLLERQLAAIEGLVARDIVVKVNSIVLPGINDDHIEAVARRMAAMGVSLFNCMPYYPNAGSDFEHLEEPGRETMERIRSAAAVHLRQMRHCARCRADAVGLLGEAPDDGLTRSLVTAARGEKPDPGASGGGASPGRPRVAVASLEGVLVNQHLGEAERLLVYGLEGGRVRLLESRGTPPPGGGPERWREMAAILSDCHTLLVGGAGSSPRRVLSAAGIRVLEIEGIIEEALDAVFTGRPLNHMATRAPASCGTACGGDGTGCG